MQKFFNSPFMRLLLALAALYGGLLSLFLGVRSFVPDANAPLVGFLNSFLHLLMLAALALFPLALLGRRRVVLVALLLPCAVFVIQYSPRLARGILRVAPVAPAGYTTLRLLSYNIHIEGVALAPMADLIREANADIVALQELTPPAADYFASAFASEYPYQAFHPKSYDGQGLMSRYPIVADEFWQDTSLFFPLGNQESLLAINGQMLTVINVHPVHPGLNRTWYDSAPHAGEVETILARANQAQAKGQLVIMLGDWNMTDQSTAYSRVISQYQDVFAQVGAGMGYTFPDWSTYGSRDRGIQTMLSVLGPFLRLDYVFCSAWVLPLSAHAYTTAAGSDHRPLLAEVALPIRP
jgi:vancomycin resistance protein VanJ